MSPIITPDSDISIEDNDNRTRLTVNTHPAETDHTQPFLTGEETAFLTTKAESTAMVSFIENRHVPPITVGTVLGNTYKIEALINRGGMGAVYRARHVLLNTMHAVKVIVPELTDSAQLIELFKHEAAILQQINHDGVVRCHGFNQDEYGRLYLIMVLIEGTSLLDILKDGPLSPSEISILFDRLATSLAAAHAMGIVHRDMCPANILLPGGRIDRAKIIDFGIAKRLSTGFATIIGDNFAGRFAYASPEQVGMFGGEVDARSDSYSVGLVLAHAASGKPLDMGRDIHSIVSARKTIPDLSGLPLDLQELLNDLLAPNPQDRPTNIAELVGVLDPNSSAQRPPKIRRLPQVPAAYGFEDRGDRIVAVRGGGESDNTEAAAACLDELRSETAVLQERLAAAHNTAPWVVKQVSRLHDTIASDNTSLNAHILALRIDAVEAAAESFYAAGAEAELAPDAVSQLAHIVKVGRRLQSAYPKAVRAEVVRIAQSLPTDKEAPVKAIMDAVTEDVAGAATVQPTVVDSSTVRALDELKRLHDEDAPSSVKRRRLAERLVVIQNLLAKVLEIGKRALDETWSRLPDKDHPSVKATMVLGISALIARFGNRDLGAAHTLLSYGEIERGLKVLESGFARQAKAAEKEAKIAKPKTN